MPELPEVETTRRGITPHIRGRQITGIQVRNPNLRWPVAEDLAEQLTGQVIDTIKRRGKYLLLETAHGTLILHLGMSGSLRILATETPAGKHDHFDLQLGEVCLRLRDPRRFGAVLWTPEPHQHHPLIRHLGPEPLGEQFSADYLFRQTRKRRSSIKQLIMDGRIVVGVGNIYANEALFMSGIHPLRAGARVTRLQCEGLVEAIRSVLAAAIEQGGTTLRDFQREDGKPGYFTQALRVYGKADEPCPTCAKPITHRVIGQRSSYYCTHCQK